LANGVNHKINLISYFAYPRHGGVEGVTIRINASEHWLLQDINWNCNCVEHTGHKCELFSYCYMRFYLSWPINWTSPWTLNCRNSDHKVA